jgi:hypothetical protein
VGEAGWRGREPGWGGGARSMWRSPWRWRLSRSPPGGWLGLRRPQVSDAARRGGAEAESRRGRRGRGRPGEAKWSMRSRAAAIRWEHEFL